MKSNRVMSGLFHGCEVITRLAYLNLLWVVSTLMGLVIFGIFPATIAMFTVIRKWLLGQPDIPVFRTYWMAYKQNFLRAQVIGLILTILGAILYADYRFFFEQDGMIFDIIKVLTGSAIFLFAMVVMYIFPVYVHFELRTFQYLKNALLIGLSQLLYSLAMMLGTAVLFFAFIKYSGLLVIFGISVHAYWITWIALIVFRQLEKLKETQSAE